MTDIHFRRIDRADVRQILRWRYPAPYDFYNLDHEPTDADVAVFFDPGTPHFAAVDAAGELNGFVAVGLEARVPGGDYTLPAHDIGIGLRPDRTGQGLGKIVLTDFLAFMGEHFPPLPLRATIAAFNLRSQRTFQTLGFEEISRFRTGNGDTGRDWVIVLQPLDELPRT